MNGKWCWPSNALNAKNRRGLLIMMRKCKVRFMGFERHPELPQIIYVKVQSKDIFATLRVKIDRIAG